MKSKNTSYNGIVFRSKLEAKWAAFLNFLNIKYDYEPRCFQFDDDVYYLPDFYLPEIGVWIEIKGPNPSELELNNCSLLYRETKSFVFLFSGFPEVRSFGDGLRPCNFDAYYFGDFGNHRVMHLLEMLCAITSSDKHKIIKAIYDCEKHFNDPQSLSDVLRAYIVTKYEEENGLFSISRRYS